MTTVVACELCGSLACKNASDQYCRTLGLSRERATLKQACAECGSHACVQTEGDVCRHTGLVRGTTQRNHELVLVEKVTRSRIDSGSEALDELVPIVAPNLMTG